MLTKRQRKLALIVVSMLGASLAVVFVLLALKRNIDLYYTPSHALDAHLSLTKHVRLGGLVKIGSVKDNKQHSAVYFDLTDYKKTITVVYAGLLPSLFREGQGIVASGCFNEKGQFVADQVLAKHDENYHPPKSGVQ